jgi:hypothetical protein
MRGGSGKTGTVATDRGAVLATGGGMSTGRSSRDTSRSPERAVSALSRWALSCELTPFGMILLGPPSALMIGGSDGKAEPPNIAR